MPYAIDCNAASGVLVGATKIGGISRGQVSVRAYLDHERVTPATEGCLFRFQRRREILRDREGIRRRFTGHINRVSRIQGNCVRALVDILIPSSTKGDTPIQFAQVRA